MKIGNGLIVGVLIAGCVLGITSCGGKSSEQQVKEQASKVYYLNPDERALAKANAQAYFEQSFPTNAPGKETVNGKLLSVQPSDSNKNGLVSATGYLPNINSGAYVEKTVFCPYTKDAANCSLADTVK